MRLKLLRCFRHGARCVPNKLVVFKAALGTGKVVCLKILWCFRHGTGCVPNKLVFFKAALGTGKVVCLPNLWLSKLLSAQERLCA